MKCPACGHEMSEMSIGGIKVDACQGGCGGVWFDQFEMKKFDEPHEASGAPILSISVDANVKIDRAQRKCPRCVTVIMRRFFASVLHKVEIDECANCAGVFLDANELQMIRQEFTTERERTAAAQKVFSDLFDKDLDKLRQQSKEKTEKAQTVSRIFKFICPTNYIPGKQKWGAW